MSVQWHDRLPSTMDVAHQLAAGGAPHGTAVAARIQEAGRGRRGRSWVSPDGGLWLSVVCRPVAGDRPEMLSLRVGLALARVLEAELPGLPVLALKWPNDLYVDDRKVAGVLCEARWEGERPTWIVAGVGVNVRNAIPENLADEAVALVRYTPEADPVRLADSVAAAVSDTGRSSGAMLSPGELAEFRRRDWLRGRRVTSPVAGTADGIEPTGALRIVDADGGAIRVSAGDVALHRP